MSDDDVMRDISAGIMGGKLLLVITYVHSGKL